MIYWLLSDEPSDAEPTQDTLLISPPSDSTSLMMFSAPIPLHKSPSFSHIVFIYETDNR